MVKQSVSAVSPTSLPWKELTRLPCLVHNQSGLLVIWPAKWLCSAFGFSFSQAACRIYHFTSFSQSLLSKLTWRKIHCCWYAFSVFKFLINWKWDNCCNISFPIFTLEIILSVRLNSHFPTYVIRECLIHLHSVQNLIHLSFLKFLLQ